MAVREPWSSSMYCTVIAGGRECEHCPTVTLSICSWPICRGCFDKRPVAVKRILPECFDLADREVGASDVKTCS